MSAQDPTEFLSSIGRSDIAGFFSLLGGPAPLDDGTEPWWVDDDDAPRVNGGRQVLRASRFDEAAATRIAEDPAQPAGLREKALRALVQQPVSRQQLGPSAADLRH